MEWLRSDIARESFWHHLQPHIYPAASPLYDIYNTANSILTTRVPGHKSRFKSIDHNPHVKASGLTLNLQYASIQSDPVCQNAHAWYVMWLNS